ncbi:MAG: hypothetical protein AB7F86_14615 [Bdellovibrionales bacterium]
MIKSWLQPKWRVALFLFLANVAWILATWKWLDRTQWLWVVPLALSINFLLLFYDQILPFSRTPSEVLEGQDPWGLLKMIHGLSEKFEIPCPEVHLIAHPSAQIFTFGKSRRRLKLHLTRGLLDLLSPEELYAVLTYQMEASQRSQTLLNYWIAALVDLVIRLANGVESLFAFIFGWRPPLTGWIVGPWMGVMQLLLISRQDFLLLDQKTALKISHPDDLAQALWKMESYAQTRPWRDSWVYSHMCMVSPLKSSAVFGFLRAQPTLPGRIKQLVGRYPL